MIVGNNAKLQIGKQTDFSTAVAQTLALEFTKETLKLVPAYMSSDALVGRKATSRMDLAALKVAGDFEIICNPDNMGPLLAYLFGDEAAPAAVSGSAVYDHVFSPISAVSASSLFKTTIAVDRGAAIKGFVGCKIDSMKLSVKPKDYLRATFSVIGRSEETDTIDAVALSTKLPFQFIHGSVTVDAVAYAEITGIDFTYKNNLEDDLFVLNGTQYMIEIEPQAREVTASLSVNYSSTTEATRAAKFAAGTACAIVLTFQSTETVLAGKYYTMTISIPTAYITAMDPNVGGPERIKMNMEVKGTETASAQVCQITLRDGRATKWVA